MIDDPEIPVAEVAGELLPVVKRGRPKAVKRKPGAKARKVVWLLSARVIDLPAYDRLRATGAGAKKLSRALSTTVATAQKLMAGIHWQQNPERVVEFNRYHGASISPAGVPTAGDLAKHGGAYALPLAQDSEGEKDLRRIIEDAGVAPGLVSDAMRRMKLLSGDGGAIPGKPDTKYFQDAFDQKLALALACLDPVAIASASVADLTRLTSMLTEKRALLRGEPTSIVRNEQRGGLDKLAELLLTEVGRRGIVLDAPKGPGGYREVIDG